MKATFIIFTLKEIGQYSINLSQKRSKIHTTFGSKMWNKYISKNCWTSKLFNTDSKSNENHRRFKDLINFCYYDDDDDDKDYLNEEHYHNKNNNWSCTSHQEQWSVFEPKQMTEFWILFFKVHIPIFRILKLHNLKIPISPILLCRVKIRFSCSIKQLRLVTNIVPYL